ncbi:hypothetical protein TanjilG_13608 [Lupinus angustifolius]|uniref:peroxidase n=2 Tax=Lupinus angustifolius TaxID=3871 RepID=A0A1J7HR76_LUPAN|nr:hypothetical protein TanjilG_13608 [Lupinus angustifolius]
MVTLRFLQLCAIVALNVFGVCLIIAESTLMVNFISVPLSQSKSSNAVFRFQVERLDGSNACKRSSCSFSCQLDGKVYHCGANGIVLRNLTQNQEHNFLLNVTTNKGERNSSLYSWFIDTIAPTAAITSEQMYTNAKRVTIDITFSEPCTGLGGFKCVNSSICDVMVAGPAKVDVSSLLVTTPGVKYSLEVILSSKSIHGRAVITLEDNTCSDQAGNKFLRTNDSTLIIHFDRRPVMVDFWTSVPSSMMKINSIPRTIVATSKPEDLIIFLDFSIPLRNSTEQIRNALNVNSGALTRFHGRSNETRRFAFKLKNISRTEIITVKLQATSILGKTGTHVSPVDPITFLYDLTKPSVVLRTSSPNETRDSNIHIIAEFTKPVFGFEASMVVVLGGRLIRHVYIEVKGTIKSTIFIDYPSSITEDSIPAISIALYSFVSAGTIATSLITAIVCLSSANLEAISMLAMGGTTSHASNPSMNLHGMVGHLQVFALTSWFSTNQPIKYSETTRGLWWLIPHHKLPWEDYDHSSTTLENEKLTTRTNGLSVGEYSYNSDHQQTGLMSSLYIEHKVSFPTEITSKYGWFHDQRSTKNVFYGLPLSSIEYFTYFLRGEPISASNVIKAMENYKGWKEMEMNLFWLGIGGGFFILVHVFMILFLRWRTGKLPQGTLSMPRFEFFLLILILPCISQSSTFVIKGGTTRGIITGVLLLAIPAAFILSVFLFLTIAISSGSFAQYKEFKQVTNEEWRMKLWFFLVGRPTPVMIASENGDAEKDASENVSLAGDGFDTVIKAKQAVEAVCPGIVSCADILALATRDVVALLGGPSFNVELGRRDGLVSKASNVEGNLPKASFNLNQLNNMFSKHNLSQIDMISLSGAHTIGFSHCDQFSNRLYSFSSSSSSSHVDPTLDSNYAQQLESECPQNPDPSVAVALDLQTPSTFDNLYYLNLVAGKGLLSSDQVLFTDTASKSTVVDFANNPNEFNGAFVTAMRKLGRVGVKIGNQGEIRKDCTKFNS